MNIEARNAAPAKSDDTLNVSAADASMEPLHLVPLAPKDQMFGLTAAYRADTHPLKVDLGVGAYRDNHAKPLVLRVVKQADERLRSDPDLNHEYLPIAGLSDYLQASARLILGKSNIAIAENRVASVQTISGTGALSLAARFLSAFYPQSEAKKVYVSDPPYVNHLPILHEAGLETALYPYYDANVKALDIRSLLATLRRCPDRSIVLLHACAHNPTGLDPTRSQWIEIARVMKSKNMVPFFDSAYQGFASGDLDSDAWAVRHFVEQDFHTTLIAQSYAKNFGLYGERVGCLHVVSNNADLSTRILSQLQRLQRVSISTPPAYGARIVSLVLNDPVVFAQWVRELKVMAMRINTMRTTLRQWLEEGDGVPGRWRHITESIGMFCYTGLSPRQVQTLREVYHVYMTPDARISVSGLNENNVLYVAEAFRAVSVAAKL